MLYHLDGNAQSLAWNHLANAFRRSQSETKLLTRDIVYTILDDGVHPIVGIVVPAHVVGGKGSFPWYSTLLRVEISTVILF